MRFFYRAKIGVAGRAVFYSHGDEVRIFERALRRADLKLAFSEGFNPRPLFSFGVARPLGYGSFSDFIEFVLRESEDKGNLKKRLNLFLPEGIRILDVEEIDEPSFGKLHKKVSGPVLALTVNRAKLTDFYRNFQELLEESGSLFEDSEEEKRFFELLGAVLNSVKIFPNAKEGRVLFFRQTPQQKTIPRIDRILLESGETGFLKDSLSGIYIYGFEVSP
jgi:radical SAM-linked protein